MTRLVLVLGLLTGLAPFAIDMYLPAFPQLADDLHARPAQVQLTLTACLVGLAVGQLVVGPISDRRGRRGPLLVGLGLYVLASLLCAAAPSIEVLVALRFVQGATGAAGIVLATAVVRDLHSGAAASRYFSQLMLINGVAPIIAPIIGAQVLRVGDWRHVFLVLAVLGLLSMMATVAVLPETLPPERRRPAADRGTAFAIVLSDRRFLSAAMAGSFAFGAMFAYIAGSPFVLQELHGMSPQRYSAAFGANALGIVAVGQLSGWLVGRGLAPARLLLAGTVAGTVGGLALLASVALDVGLAGILPSLFLIVASMGLVMPNSAALALEDHPTNAGAAAALLGALRYVIGGAAAPLVGLGGADTAVPMGVVIVALSAAGLGCALAASRLHR